MKSRDDPQRAEWDGFVRNCLRCSRGNIPEFPRMSRGALQGISGNVAGFPFEIRTGSLSNKSLDLFFFLSTPVCSVAFGAIFVCFLIHKSLTGCSTSQFFSCLFTTIDARKTLLRFKILTR